MARIEKSKTREIVEDFADEIKRGERLGPKPQKEVIFFRNERQNGIERDVYDVPIELLRYRKDNGRIRVTLLAMRRNLAS